MSANALVAAGKASSVEIHTLPGKMEYKDWLLDLKPRRPPNLHPNNCNDDDTEEDEEDDYLSVSEWLEESLKKETGAAALGLPGTVDMYHHETSPFVWTGVGKDGRFIGGASELLDYSGALEILPRPQPRRSPAFDRRRTPGHRTADGKLRIGFQLQFAVDKLECYLRDHEYVWPEMQYALREAGWHNYSLFYRNDGLAFGYFETDARSFDQACANMEHFEVNEIWQDAMAKYTVANASPIDAAQELTHYFYLGVDREP